MLSSNRWCDNVESMVKLYCQSTVDVIRLNQQLVEVYRLKRSYFRGQKRSFGGLTAQICYEGDVGETILSILAEIQKSYIFYFLFLIFPIKTQKI